MPVRPFTSFRALKRPVIKPRFRHLRALNEVKVGWLRWESRPPPSNPVA